MSEVRFNAEAWLQRAVPAVNAGLTEMAKVIGDFAHDRFGSDGSPSSPGGVPGIDTGTLQRSIRYVSPESLGTPLRAAWGTAEKHGRYLEFGGWIRAKNVKYLPVPVDRALAATMRRRGPAGSVRGIPGLKYIPPRKGANNGGRLVLDTSVRVHVRGSGKSRTASAGKTVFVLKESVFIAARPWVMSSTYGAAPEATAAMQRVTSEVGKSLGIVI